jgi:two-component system sensor histidine kinase DesK
MGDSSTAAAQPARRVRLIPQGAQLGWTPYAWLVYLSFFFFEPIDRISTGRATTAYVTLTAVGTIVFLASYFRGYWVRGADALPIVALQVGLAAAFAPVNPGAVVFFIYAGGLGAQMPRARDAFRTLVAVTVCVAIVAYVAHWPLFAWVVGLVMTPLIGGVNLHFSQVRQANARLLLAQEEIAHLARVAERERIARDLHDVLGHTLSLIVLKAELASKLAELDPARAAQEIRDVERVSREALHEVRATVTGYRATLADEAARARSMLTAAAVRGDVVVEPLSLERAREEAMALALREGVTNVVRHAGASTCRVRVGAREGACVLEVEDDGRGGLGPEGSGLHGMRERVEALGGTVTRAAVRRARGTLLRVTLPVVGDTAPRPA